jgi:hypothetical protein
MHGLTLARAIYVAAELGVADELRDGPRGIIDLAGQVAANAGSLYRLMRFLSGHGIFHENEANGSFESTGLSYCLRRDVPGSVRSTVLLWGGDFTLACMSQALDTVRTGKPAVSRAFGPAGWNYMRQNPEEAKLFDDAMTEMCSLAAPAIAMSYDFGKWESLMDIGGGSGTLLGSILGAHPDLRGVLADQPEVLERARKSGFPADVVASRASLQECDFLREIPQGRRAYMLKTVIIDWDDEHVLRILENCRKAVPNDGALLIVDLFIEPGPAPSLANAADVAMMVTWGSKVRTIPETAALLSAAGFQLSQVVPTPAGYFVLEARPR